MSKIRAPFTPEQVIALDHWKNNRLGHPFTCACRDEHPAHNGEKGLLIPTVRGWICQFCDYTQDWAHSFMCAPVYVIPEPPAKPPEAPARAEQSADAILIEWRNAYSERRSLPKQVWLGPEAVAILSRYTDACDALLNHLDAHPAQPGSPVPPGPSQQPQSSAAAQDRGEI